MTALSADRPSSQPQDNLFGHAPFAESLAYSICCGFGNDGLVLALDVPCGSGKSTVLSYVRHFLEQHPKTEQPVIVTFNPWRLSCKENLARAFLRQLQAVLSTTSEKLKKLCNLLRDFAESVGGDRPECHARRCGWNDRQSQKKPCKTLSPISAIIERVER